MTVFFVFPKEIAVSVKAADALVFRASEYLIPSTPQHLCDTFGMVSKSALAGAVEGVPQTNRAIL
jgi:hypothetical protein